jgi:hypothetical protein
MSTMNHLRDLEGIAGRIRSASHNLRVDPGYSETRLKAIANELEDLVREVRKDLSGLEVAI